MLYSSKKLVHAQQGKIEIGLEIHKQTIFFHYLAYSPKAIH